MNTKTSEELMILHQSGDPDAFKALHQRHRSGVEGRIHRMLSQWAPQLLPGKADLTQEVFARIHSHREAFLPSTRFNAWLFATVQRIVLTHIKHETRRCRDFRRTTSCNDGSELVDPEAKRTAAADAILSRLEPSIRNSRLITKMSSTWSTSTA